MDQILGPPPPADFVCWTFLVWVWETGTDETVVCAVVHILCLVVFIYTVHTRLVYTFGCDGIHISILGGRIGCYDVCIMSVCLPVCMYITYVRKMRNNYACQNRS